MGNTPTPRERMPSVVRSFVKPQSKSQPPSKLRKHSEIGRYKVVRDKISVKTGPERTSDTSRFVYINNVVNVVALKTVDDRLRGQVEEGGWISLNDKSGNQWAQQIDPILPGRWVVTEDEVDLFSSSSERQKTGVAPRGAVLKVLEVQNFKLGTQEQGSGVWGRSLEGGWLCLLDGKTGKYNGRFVDGQNDVLKEGWLEKQGWYVQSWRTRWFLLRSDGALEYYTCESLKEMKGIVDVSPKCNILANHNQKEFGFVIKEPKREWFFGARDAQQRDEWVQLLSDIVTNPDNLCAEDRRSKMVSVPLDDYDDLLQHRPSQYRSQAEAGSPNPIKNVENNKLPQGWEMCIDEISGFPFYVDHNTRTTHWELPESSSMELIEEVVVDSPAVDEDLEPDFHRTPSGDREFNRLKSESISIKAELEVAEQSVRNISSLLKHVEHEKEDLQKRIEHEEEKKLCVICMENAKNVLVVPCGHYAFCSSCSVDLSGQECPICRSKILRTVVVHEASIV